MSILTANDPVSNAFLSVVEHVFMPPKLPQEDPGDAIEQKMNVALCDHLIGASQVFLQDALQDVSPSQRSLWENMIKMIKLARRAADIPFQEAELQGVFSNMAIGDVFSMHIRAQNAGLIVRKLSSDIVQFEAFEVSPKNTEVMTTTGKLLCSYPGPAIRVPQRY
ncbi:hypothetical protein BJV77DRAFT_234428 [Russula vinacea]|nr:hypothetical protein BJV77DRAFT_234428 [Russula vinacea]